MKTQDWHRLTKKDQKRILCSDRWDGECARPATICLYSRFTRNGGTQGISFHYYCDEHAKASRARR